MLVLRKSYANGGKKGERTIQASCFSLSASLIRVHPLWPAVSVMFFYNLSPSLLGHVCFDWPISVNRLYVLWDPGGPSWRRDCGRSLPVILPFALSNPPKWRQQLDCPVELSAALDAPVCCTFLVSPLKSSGHKGKKIHKKENGSIYLKTLAREQWLPFLSHLLYSCSKMYLKIFGPELKKMCCLAFAPENLCQ